MRAAFRFLAVLGLTCASGAVQADDMDLSEWLVRMGEATRTTNYQGTVMYRMGDMMESMQLIHRFREGEVWERIHSTSGAPREIIRRGDEVTCIIPSEKKVTVDKLGASPLFPSLPSETVEKLHAYYAFEPIGMSRVAGRQCRGIRVAPRDGYRYGYRIWIDEDTTLPMKVSLIGDDGSVLEQVAFTEIAFPATISDAALQPTLAHEGFAWSRVAMESKASAAGPSRWHLTDLPAGFEVIDRQMRSDPIRNEDVETIVLSDGLSSVSIYSKKLETANASGDGMYEGPSGMGALRTYGVLRDDYHLTVVGEVPPVTVKRIAMGIRTKDSAP